MVTKVISGGQTGVDRTGLEVAFRLGLETGGTAPKGYRTENGSDYTLRDVYHLRESWSSAYPPRTEDNVKEADGTVLFGDMHSPGCKLTIRLCQRHKKPYTENPSVAFLKAWVEQNHIYTLNVAGNRLHTNPQATRTAKTVLTEALQ